MKASIQIFNAGKGDCVFFQIDDGVKSIVTMIDCGKYTPAIRKHVEDNLGRHLHYLVVTHIDNDHIDGLVEMLEQTPDLTIDRILYNCNQLWDGQRNRKLTETLTNEMQTLRENLPARQTNDGGKANASKAVTLAEKLAEKEEWWQAWKKDEYITTEIRPIVLDEHDEKYGVFTILSPNKGDIKKLNTKFKVEYSRLTKHLIEEGWYVEGQEVLYELVARLVAMKRNNYKSYSSLKMAVPSNALDQNRLKQAFEFKPSGVTDENEASIALMWEYGGKKVLLMGDAEPDEVAKQINDVYGKGVLDLEAIKVSHHGSKHSTSYELMCCVDSDHYFFTGGNLTDKPSLEAIMKIINRSDKRKRTLHFNNPGNTIVKALASDSGASVRKEYNFDISESHEYHFEY